MECGNNQIQKLIFSLLEPIKENPEQLIVKGLKPDQYKMYYTAKGLLPMVSKMLRLDLDPEKMIRSLVFKLECLPEEKWNSLDSLIRRVLDGDNDAMEQIKKSILE